MSFLFQDNIIWDSGRAPKKAHSMQSCNFTDGALAAQTVLSLILSDSFHRSEQAMFEIEGASVKKCAGQPDAYT